MTLVGFSTGTLYPKNISIEDSVNFFYSIGANAVELSFGAPQDILNFKVSKSFLRSLDRFTFVSVHAPFKEVSYGKAGSEPVIEKLLEFALYIKNGIVFHPSDISNVSSLSALADSVLIENMDRRKSVGKTPEDLASFRNACSGFVLDLFHVYDTDPSMNSMDRFARFMGSHLAHLHVSGSNSSESHCLLYCATNQNIICDAVQKVYQNSFSPIILEGRLFGDLVSCAKKKFKYVMGLVD